MNVVGPGLKKTVHFYQSAGEEFVLQSAHIDAIEKEVVLKEKSYLQEISHLRQEISKHLKVQLEKELKRKEELITQASKLCDVINGPSKQQGNVNRTHGIDDSNVSAAIVMADDDWEVVMDP
ncbi:unnamed protein product [Gongylonema pulchrum]|uniref:Ovule protein n=1 Tax=Gongylonema pulchrum TaxID=637853 RepID=A0A183D198_9BILA|nr:unnamed protein product [Gongylonema pulchrum]